MHLKFNLTSRTLLTEAYEQGFSIHGSPMDIVGLESGCLLGTHVYGSLLSFGKSCCIPDIYNNVYLKCIYYANLTNELCNG